MTEQQELILAVLEAAEPSSRGQQGGPLVSVLVAQSRLVQATLPLVFSRGRRGRGFSGAFFKKALNPIHKGSTLMT